MDVRVKLLFLLVSSVLMLFKAPLYIMAGMAFVVAIGLYLSNMKKASIINIIVIAVLYSITNTSNNFTIVSFLATFAIILYPMGISGVLLMRTAQTNQIIIALKKMKVPRVVIIPFCVSLRYFPTVKDELSNILKSLKMRGLYKSAFDFVIHPIKMLEYFIVPVLLSASVVADDLTLAAITKGIDNPCEHSSIVDINLKHPDYIFSTLSILIMILGITKI